MKSALTTLGVTLLAATLFFALGVGLGAGAAQAGDIYTVSGVHVDVTAGSAIEARTTAQATAQRQGLATLLRRLTLPEDWANLPVADDATMQRAVRSFAVNNEKASATRYIADMTVAFVPGTVQQLLTARGIAFGQVQAKPIMLLAVFEKPGLRVFWEDPNPWRDAWNHQDLANSLTPVILPLGDIEEFGIVTTAQAMSGDQAAFASLAARYGANDTAIAFASADASGTKVTVTMKQYAGSTAPTSTTQTFTGATPDEALSNAAAGTLDALALKWKRDTVVRGGIGGTLVADARFSGLGEWEYIRKTLASSPFVADMDVQGISSGGAEISITYRGTSEKLAEALRSQNVALTQSEGTWQIARSAAPATAPAAALSAPAMPQ